MIARVHSASSPLFVFAGGGTGGHIYPAIAVARAIRTSQPDVRFLFLGTQRPIDRHITGTIDCEFVPQTLKGVRLAPWRLVQSLVEFRQASAMCRRRFAAERPAIVIGTGGLAAVPAIREAYRLGIVTALFNPDAIPGKANRHLASRAGCVFAQFEQTVSCFPSDVEVVVSGCPVRPDFHLAKREEGIHLFGLDPRLKTLLVTGASLGARTVNEAVVANATFLDGCQGWQVLHLTGQNDFEFVEAAYREQGLRRVNVIAYTEEMAKAMAAADLIVSRAGASSLAEIMSLGRPSILMPYPFHRDQHQVANARCLSDEGGAELVLDKADMRANSIGLRGALHALMQDEKRRLYLAARARQLGAARRGAAAQIAQRLLEIAGLKSASSSQDSIGFESLKAC